MAPLYRFVSQLRFPWLFGVVLAAFGLDLVFPDLIPFIDEILLGLSTIFVGAWRKRKVDKIPSDQLTSDRAEPEPPE